MLKKATALAALLFVATAALAAPPEAPKNTLALTQVAESLSGGRDAWASTELRYVYKKNKTDLLQAGLVRDERYQKTDVTVFAGAATALRPGLVLDVEAGGGDNQILPQFYAKSGLTQDMGNGLLLSAGLRRTHYGTGHTVGYEFGAEQYVAKFRAGADLVLTKPSFQPDTNKAYRLSLAYYPTDTTSASVFGAKGTETEATPGGVLFFKMTAVGVSGKLAITDKTALTVFASKTMYDDSYTRTAIGLSLAQQF